MLLTSVDLGCSDEIVTIIAMLSVQNIFYRPKEKQEAADQRKAKFNHHEGDHLTYLTVYEAWKGQNYSMEWCHQNYIQGRSMRRAQDVRKQIIGLLDRYKFELRSCGGDYALVRKAIVAGFFFHAARKDPKEGYKTIADDHQVYIHPSSSLFNKEPEWVVYHELVFTTKEYMRDVCAINPKWLIDVAPNFFKFTDEKEFVRSKRNEKIEPLNQKYGDPNAWRLSKRKG